MVFKKILLLGLFMCLSLSLSACASPTTTTLDTPDYEDYDFIESFDEIWTRSEGTYLVYLYSTSCVNCAAIKSSVLAFAATYTAHNIYFFDLTDNAETDAKTAYLEKVGQAQLVFPVLLLVVDQDFDKTQTSKYFYDGKTKITAILNDLLTGTFTF